MTDELDISADGALGLITLNRPQAINALSRGMIDGIAAALLRWRDDPEIRAVLFTGNGPKGFCAGGDVRAARALVLDGKAADADAYFVAEYRMNGMIADYPKPLVVLGHGVTMGGGIGIAGHCAFRVTQPGARFAMPETAIGFFADVGVNAILANAPLNRALLFLMAGASVGAADALALGLADAVVAPEEIDGLRADLVGAAGSSQPETAIVRLLEAVTIEPGETAFCALADLLPDEPPASLAEFLERVAAVLELADISALLATRCPASLVANFLAQNKARGMDVKAVLEMDLRLARLMSRRADFVEGVRAVLVDKDQTPEWRPPSMAAFEAQGDGRPLREAVNGP